MTKRVLSLDMLRGLAVFGMTAIHVFLNTSELVELAGSDPFSLPPELLIIAVFAVIFSHWRGFFLMISGIAHLYSMTEMIKHGTERKKILISQIRFGFVLFFFGVFKEAFLNQWSYLGGWMETGEWDWTYWRFGYFSEALENVGLSIVMTSVLFYFLSANDGLKKTNRNLLVTGAIACCFLLFAPMIFEWANLITGATAAGRSLQSGEYHWEVFPNWYDYITRLFINQYAGRESPLFPMYAYSLVGTMIGWIITQEGFEASGKSTTFIKKGYFVGLFLVIAGILWWILIENASLKLNFHVHPTWFVLFSCGLQCLFLFMVMSRIEFNAYVDLDKVKRRTQYLRRWGIMALTIYALAFLEFVPRLIFNGLWDVDFRHRTEAPFWPMVFMLVVVMIMFEFILRVWERVKFKGSFEFLLMKIGKKGKKYNPEDPLNVQGILYEVEPILFVTPKLVEKNESKYPNVL